MVDLTLLLYRLFAKHILVLICFLSWFLSCTWFYLTHSRYRILLCLLLLLVLWVYLFGCIPLELIQLIQAIPIHFYYVALGNKQLGILTKTIHHHTAIVSPIHIKIHICILYLLVPRHRSGVYRLVVLWLSIMIYSYFIFVLMHFWIGLWVYFWIRLAAF